MQGIMKNQPDAEERGGSPAKDHPVVPGRRASFGLSTRRRPDSNRLPAKVSDAAAPRASCTGMIPSPRGAATIPAPVMASARFGASGANLTRGAGRTSAKTRKPPPKRGFSTAGLTPVHHVGRVRPKPGSIFGQRVRAICASCSISLLWSRFDPSLLRCQRRCFSGSHDTRKLRGAVSGGALRRRLRSTRGTIRRSPDARQALCPTSS